jgi:hypothetical protein
VQYTIFIQSLGSGDLVFNFSTYLKMFLVKYQRVAHACNPSSSGGRDQEDRG